ncbi:YqgE/AlgH family protein [Rickettsiales bacterium LUAb2]
MLTPIKPINLSTLQGKFIVAHPNMPDNRLAKTIIYITEHNKNGAEGLVINKTSAYTFINLMNSLNNFTVDQTLISENVKNIRILRGGPVNNDKIFILHSNDYKVKESSITTNVDSSIAYSKSAEVLQDLINGQGPEKMSIFIGNCTWTSAQLDQELEQDIWLVCENTENYLFNNNFEKLWEGVYQSLGINNTSSAYFYTNTEKTLQ